MTFKKLALIAAALALTAPAAAETRVEPAVQPGGDIPSKFRPPFRPSVPRGDIPGGFNAPRSSFTYVRREAMIPMRDGAKLYTVLIIPKGVPRAPIMLDRTPYEADKTTGRGLGRSPRTSCRSLMPSWSGPATSSPSRTSAANIARRAIM